MILWLAAAPPLRADDLTTLSGTTYHQVRAARVEPDGVTWEHATGVCKVDFTDSPEAIRRAYHYDAARASAYQATQAEARQQAAAQARRDQQAATARRASRFREQVASSTEATPGGFVFRRRATEDPAVQSASEAIAAEQAERDLLTKDDHTIWNRQLWAIPCLLVGGGYSPGVAFDPHVDLNPQEYRAALHQPGPSLPLYLTKDYNKEVDRAAAFARGQP